MRSLSRTAFLVLAVGALSLIVASPAMAAELASSDFVIVREGITVNDDLYAAALTVRVDGRIEGDLIAVAAERVVINGTVTGSVTVFAPIVEVNGEVGGAVRATANRVTVNGHIAGDLVVTAVVVELSPDSVVIGEMVMWGNRMSSLGTVEGGLFGTMRRLDLAGNFGNSVVVNVGRLTVVDSLTVDGGLAYRSDHDAEGLEMAEVTGTITRRTPLPPNIRVRALVIFARAMIALFLTIAAVATVWNWPDRTVAAADRVAARPFRSWLAGMGVYATPVALVGVMIGMLALAPPVASLPLVAILLPIILAVVAILLAVSILAGVPAVLHLGRRMFRKVGAQGATLGGALVVALIWMIPWVGWLVPLVVLPLGLGGWMATQSPQPGVVATEPSVQDEVVEDSETD
jgi:cytoskeletal protein CcmA (bactofilin family)